MNKEELEQRIIQDLEMNVNPSYSSYKVEKEIYFATLRELKENGVINYTTISNDHPAFAGEPEKIWLV